MTEHWHYGHRWVETTSWYEAQHLRFMNSKPSHVIDYEPYIEIVEVPDILDININQWDKD